MEINDDKLGRLALSHLEAACEAHGIGSVKFKDGEMVMISLDMLKDLVAGVEAKGQTRAIIFIGTGGELKGQ
jgi:hypothetical protein